MGGLKIFKVSLHSWQRVLILLFYEDTPPSILPAPTPLFQILSTHTHPHFPVTSNLCPQFFLLSCFFGWVDDHPTFDVLFYLMIIWIYTCYLVPEQLWCMFNATRHQVYWSLTHNVVFYWYSDFISITHNRCNTLRGQ